MSQPQALACGDRERPAIQQVANGREPSSARTQGGSISGHIDPTEDAAMRRFAAAAPPPFALRKRRASRRAGVIDQSSRGRTLCHMVEVRKTVTVVFSDLAGSTAIGEGLDPESLHGLMSRYHATLRGVLELHGGTVEKFIGDAVMAVFG